MYKFKEIFYTIQGEGHHAGQPSVFCRFTGCNLWTGREEDRDKAICKFCDTDFVGMDGENGGSYRAQEFIELVKSLWPEDAVPVWAVFTGGEPLLQLDEALIRACQKNNIRIAVETNGTINAPDGIDWLCVSPKAGSEIVQRSGDELKLVFPQVGAMPEMFESWDFTFFSLQPMDDPHRQTDFGTSESNISHMQMVIDHCKRNPKWRISLQMHKIMGIP